MTTHISTKKIHKTVVHSVQILCSAYDLVIYWKIPYGTLDDWFSSVELATARVSVNFHMVSTLRKNRPEIILEFLRYKKDDVNMNRFVYLEDEGALLRKVQKIYIMLFTRHKTCVQCVPQVVLYCNENEDGKCT